MTESEFEKVVAEVRAGLWRALIPALVFNFLIVLPIAGYGAFKVRHHAPLREVLPIELVGLVLWAVMFVLLLRALKSGKTAPFCQSCGVHFKFKEKAEIINTKKCPACNAVVLQSEAQPGVQADRP